MTKKRVHSPPFRLPSNKIVFENVYCNGFHALKQFEIENLTPQTIVIGLDSTLKDQIAFQIENENIKDLDLITKNMATNTAAWATFSVATPQFNQVFNYVNHTDTIHLPPNQKCIFVLAFLPLIQNTCTFTEITGSVLFTSNTYTLSADFYATACQSILAADELDSGLIFEDSLVGESYIKDITIRNQSAIDLHWRLNTLDLMFVKNKSLSVSNPVFDWLQFVDASSFITLDNDDLNPILPFSHYTFRVIFTPKDVGKFNYDLQIENTNDVRNIIQTKIHATMRTIMHKDTLVVTSGTMLDFGDCISGSWTTQHIVLKNISESSIDIHFVTDDNVELGFNIVAKPDMQFLSSESSVLPDGHSTLSTDASFTRPESPTTSHETVGSIEEYSSIHSFASTDGENMNMLAAFNELYSINTISTTTVASSRQIAFSTIEQCNDKIEDMLLKPGVEQTISVSYRPLKDAPSSVNAGQFQRQNFNIVLEYRPNKSAKPKELKLIQCKAKTCTSFVKVTPQVIDFGDTDVGTQKSIPVKIINQSDICAHVELVFESKVLNCTQGELLIKPKSTVDLKLDIYPRKVNHAYKRQITLMNYLNRDNDQIIEVSSTNVDKHRVTFHSLFYRILTPTGANFLDFGPIALNSPAIRTCTLVNIRDASLLLGIFTSSQQEIIIYTKKKRNHSRKTSANPSDNQKIDSIPSVTDTIVTENHRTRMTHTQYHATAYLDLATAPLGHISSIKYKRKIARHMASSKGRLQNKLSVNKGDDTTTVSSISNKSHKIPTSEAAIITAAAGAAALISKTSQQQCKRYKKKKQHQQQACVGITGTTAQLKKARKKIIDWPDIAGKTRVPLDDLISILEYGSLSRTPLFARQPLEEQFVRYQLAWRTELNRLIQKGELVPTSLLQLNPNEEEDIIIVYTPISSQSLTSKNDASVSFCLLDYDQSAIQTSDEDDDIQRRRRYNGLMPVLRKVIIRAQVCKSSMELGQKNINFGIVDRGDRHHKTIVLHNKSETPLLYTIKKSGSIASGDIHLGVGRHGVVRSFGKREIEFIFIPTLPGSFMEQLEVINIRDKEDKNTISLKAMIRRPESFTIKSSELIFNSCASCNVKETIIVTNTSKQSRMFEIRIDADDVLQPQQLFTFEFFIDHEHQQSEGLLLSKEEEEEIENLEQKLKIAVRKDQTEKVQKYRRKLIKLKKQEEEDLFSMSSEEEEEGFVVKHDDKNITEEDSILFNLDSNASKSISVCFKAKTNIEGQILKQINTILGGRILIYEHKNVDTRKFIAFSVNPCTDHESCLP
ncbi:hypothetical protein INT47_008484 [Mucor saturninus]|uniref:UVR domain-containing protein n=1 Tax=Mucor saturninus TaxID=64648 RepID=A0A8H7RB12_9FUNG|nr:hypothetical protein INT47_008484 [Mucor saturninus]